MAEQRHTFLHFNGHLNSFFIHEPSAFQNFVLLCPVSSLVRFCRVLQFLVGSRAFALTFGSVSLRNLEHFE
jgi:hypothetical protein